MQVYISLHAFAQKVCYTFSHTCTQVYCSPLPWSSLLMKSSVGACGFQNGNNMRLSVIRAIQYAHAKSQIPVVFRAVLLEVFSGHALCGALLELHISKTAFLSCALKNQGELLDEITN